MTKEFIFALAGNPNSGKTTLFNELTGNHYQVGNWAGVTVESREGICKYVFHDHSTHFDTHEHESVHKHGEEHMHIKIVDLPGIYSLSPNSAEEVIARDYISGGRPDIILNIVDATNIERNLYLTTQIAEMGVPVIIALNMMDALEKNGFSIDADLLEQTLGIPVMPISASKGRGIQDLVNRALDIASKKQCAHPIVKYPAYIEQAITDLSEEMNISRFMVLKNLISEEFTSNTSNERIHTAVNTIQKHTKDLETEIAKIRYAHIHSIVNKCRTKIGENKQNALTDKIDRVVNHPVLAIPIFLGVMFLIFQITFGTIGSALTDLADNLFNVRFAGFVSSLLESVHTNSFISGLVVDGIISGVGGVVQFFPQIMLLFLFLSFLEDSGYMARTAFIMDKLFMKLGLSGRSFVPMIMGFGCTVPAIMAARTLEHEHDRRLTILLAPFMSCGAKMPVYSVFAAALFPDHAGIVIFSLYLLGVLLGIVSGLIFSRTILKGDVPPFILELPPYRMPTFKSTFHHMWEKAKDFAIRAGTIILLASVVVYILQNLDFTLHMTDDHQRSMLGVIGSFIAPIFIPCGFGNWQAAVSLLSGIAAKEAVVSTMSILYNAGSTEILSASVAAAFTPLSAYAFLVFVLLYTPCIAAVSALATEINSKKLTAFSITWQVLCAWIMSMLVYQIGSLFL